MDVEMLVSVLLDTGGTLFEDVTTRDDEGLASILSLLLRTVGILLEVVIASNESELASVLLDTTGEPLEGVLDELAKCPAGELTVELDELMVEVSPELLEAISTLLGAVLELVEGGPTKAFESVLVVSTDDKSTEGERM
ncbi:hypothetical protein VMCG_08027 [Cytospora schulzeri]|uniref:Uncharacterized protein n=1 Tax=Cytospora schulzeri TaxID=448051 RepID=A0A423VY89_9PEZI|nr:hypothetical protein VMCG_08027 [Valsa malicola]